MGREAVLNFKSDVLRGSFSRLTSRQARSVTLAEVPEKTDPANEAGDQERPLKNRGKGGRLGRGQRSGFDPGPYDCEIDELEYPEEKDCSPDVGQ